MRTAKFADDFGKSLYGVSRHVCRSLGIKLDPNRFRYCIRKVPGLMRHGVQELIAGRGWTYENDSPSISLIRISEPAVVLAGLHKFLCVIHDIIRSTGVIQAGKNSFNVITTGCEQKVHNPSTNHQSTPDHIISLHMIGTPLPLQSAINLSNAIPSYPSTSSSVSRTYIAACFSSTMELPT